MLTHGVEVVWDGKSCRPACNPLIALLSTILLIFALDFAHISTFDCIFIEFCSYLHWFCSCLYWSIAAWSCLLLLARTTVERFAAIW